MDQYDVYIDLWKQLGILQSAVDTLWTSATEKNILHLARQLRETKRAIQEWSLFFNNRHLQQLNEAIRILDNFHIGKNKLRNLRSKKQLSEFPRKFNESTIQQQIEQNGLYRQQFQTLIDQIRATFRAKLSGHAQESLHS